MPQRPRNEHFFDDGLAAFGRIPFQQFDCEIDAERRIEHPIYVRRAAAAEGAPVLEALVLHVSQSRRARDRRALSGLDCF